MPVARSMIFVEVNNGTISIEYSTLVGHLPGVGR